MRKVGDILNWNKLRRFALNVLKNDSNVVYGRSLNHMRSRKKQENMFDIHWIQSFCCMFSNVSRLQPRKQKFITAKHVK